jgi:hypothetical protein
MLQQDIDRLDDATAAVGRFAIAYQPAPLAPDRQPSLAEPVAVPLGNPLPEAYEGLEPSPADVVPTEEVVWQNVIEQLLQLLGPQPPAPLPDSLAPAAYVEPQFGEAATQPAPLAADPGPAYVIESLGRDAPPLLSLDESDLFGGSSADSIDLLSVDGSQAPPVFKGMDSDLFGRDMAIDPISIGKNDSGARTVEPSKDPAPEPGLVSDGYVSLLGEPMELKITLDDARDMANESGELFFDGDGDDLVQLSGDWIYVGARPEKGATYYTDPSGTLEVTFANTETVLV